MNENNQNNKPKGKTGIKVLILAGVIFVVVIVLASCMIKSCVGKINEALQSDPDLYSTDSGYSSQYTDYYYTGSGTEGSGELNREVVDGTPEKRTKILGNGEDVVTVMVYVCGSDLESESGAATMDIREMLDANVGDNINLILYTGGATDWQNRQMSSSVNQIYQIAGDNLYLLEKKAGNSSMTDPDTLSGFIRYCRKNFPANRNMLVLWDHGGGSIMGYGSDEKFSYSSPMTLTDIYNALDKGGVDFDFVGFDACLMGSAECAMAVSDHADYLIASEESESGYGWDYSRWLKVLSSNTSIPTIELGKKIVDDFISSTNQIGKNWSSTLSVTDLAELSFTLPEALESFAYSTAEMIEGDSDAGDYKTVAHARNNARSFGVSQGVDQVDLVHFAELMDIPEGKVLAETVRSAVKYNNTTSDMTSSYGLSIYFPCSSATLVNEAGDIYDSIGLTSEYTRCVQSYAALELSGQYIGGGTGDPFNSLYGIFGSGDYGESEYFGNSSGEDYSSSVISDLLGGLLGGDLGGFSSDYEEDDFGFFRNNVNIKAISEFLAENQFDESALVWKENSEGKPVIMLTEKQWDLVKGIELNMFYDDGEGLIDLGSDNVFSFDKDGNLIGETDGTWITIDGHYMSYYYENATVDGENFVVTGYSPVLYNGTEAELILRFDNRKPYGYIVGVRFVSSEENANVSKVMDVAKAGGKTDLESGEAVECSAGVKEGDVIEFLADFYDYKGNFLDCYVLGEPWTVGTEEPEIANIDVSGGDSGVLAMYCITDIYNKKYWTGLIPEQGIVKDQTENTTE